MRIIGNQKECEKLKRKIERLELEVKVLEEKVRKLKNGRLNKTKAILEVSTLIIELVGAILAIAILFF